MLVSCTGMPLTQSLCPHLDGTYADRTPGEKASLVSFLTGQQAAVSAGTVELTSDAVVLRVQTSTLRHVLRTPADFSCSKGNEMTLTRQAIGRIYLPPLLDQSLVTSYQFSKTESGDLRMDVYSRTTASPYGVRLSGPEQLDRTVIWAARPQR